MRNGHQMHIEMGQILQTFLSNMANIHFFLLFFLHLQEKMRFRDCENYMNLNMIGNFSEWMD